MTNSNPTSYFEHLDRIANPNYKPTDEDVLRARRLTVGAEEIKFQLDGYLFHVIDVGGQKGEREKWIEYFQGNDAVLFFFFFFFLVVVFFLFVFIVCYRCCQHVRSRSTLGYLLCCSLRVRPKAGRRQYHEPYFGKPEGTRERERDITNALTSVVQLFSDVCNHQWFADASIILFLNKSDIFREKIKSVPLTVAFPEYKGMLCC